MNSLQLYKPRGELTLCEFHQITKDGVTVAKAVQLKDKLVSWGTHALSKATPSTCS